MDTPAQRLKTFTDRFTPEVAAVARAARRKLRGLMPGAVEMVYDNYNALVCGFGPTERPSEAILSLAIFPRYVSLCFLRGARLPRAVDPGKRLDGSGSVVRHVRLAGASTLDEPEVRALIDAALAYASVPLDPRGRYRLVIKSVSAKQRPRRPRPAPATSR
jgi:hypothetical protein